MNSGKWLSTSEVADLWNSLMGGAQALRMVPSGATIAKYVRDGRLEKCGVRTEHMAGRYSTNRADLIIVIWNAAREVAHAAERAAGVAGQRNWELWEEVGEALRDVPAAERWPLVEDRWRGAMIAEMRRNTGDEP